jgi:hypothetical protein
LCLGAVAPRERSSSSWGLALITPSSCALFLLTKARGGAPPAPCSWKSPPALIKRRRPPRSKRAPAARAGGLGHKARVRDTYAHTSAHRIQRAPAARAGGLRSLPWKSSTPRELETHTDRHTYAHTRHTETHRQTGDSHRERDTQRDTHRHARWRAALEEQHAARVRETHTQTHTRAHKTHRDTQTDGDSQTHTDTHEKKKTCP